MKQLLDIPEKETERVTHKRTIEIKIGDIPDEIELAPIIPKADETHGAIVKQPLQKKNTKKGENIDNKPESKDELET